MQGKEAVDAANKVAAGRGDTKDIDRFQPYIQVLLPQYCKRKPQEEHTKGDSYMETLDTITQISDNVNMAGMLTMLAAIK